MTLRLVTLIACTLAPGFATFAAAQPVQPLLNAATPYAVLRGQSTEITVAGLALNTATAVVLPDDAGLTATIVPNDKSNGTELKLAIQADADATPGPREIRLASANGVSNPAQVWVEQYPIVVDTAPNTDPMKAQPIPLPATLTGNVDAPGDSDCYRFTAAKGQVLVFNLVAGRMRSALDANLIVYDAGSGRELASNNDTFDSDPFLAFTVPAHGEYVVEIRDLQYRGGKDYGYRVEAGQIPFVQSISPTSSRRGRLVDVKATGFNLDPGSETIRLDLTHVEPGRIGVRARTTTGFVSNELPFDVTALPQVAEVEPNDDAKSASLVPLGSDVSGVIDKPNDVDVFRFKLDKPQRVVIDALARRIGSPLDAILTLSDASGKPIATNDDAAGADARVGRELPAGEYTLAIRDLGYAGGPGYAYRVSVAPTLAAADAPPQDFGLTFQPDTPRLNRGGTTKLWCDLGRQNFPADVTVAVEGLPPGVTVSSPSNFPAATSGVLTLTASADAPLGTFPIALKAVAPLNGELVTRAGRPAAGATLVQQAYLTVLDAAPFTVQPLATLPAERIEQLASEIATLTNRVLSPNAEVDARQAEWEKKVLADPGWVVIDPIGLGSSAQAGLVKQPDGSILAGPGRQPIDTYTITANTALKGIVAVKLEVIPDPSLGSNGPGKAPNGNFVLSRFAATIAPQCSTATTTPVEFAKAVASFSKGAYDVAGAIDDKPETGWAIAPEVGKPHFATFIAKAPAGDGSPQVLTFTMEHKYGSNHVIGRFRISVSTDPAAVDQVPVPEAVLAIVKAPAEQRTPQQKSALSVYYRALDPAIKADITKGILLGSLVAPRAEIARLDAALKKQTPQLDAEQAKWEHSLAADGAWQTLDATDFRSAAGAGFVKEPADSVFVYGVNPPTDTYTFVAPTTLKNVTGVRIEALPDPRLPGNGPGRSAGGNFVLSGVRVSAAPADKPGESKPVEIAGGVASFEQDNYPVAATLDEKPETGWAIAPFAGRPATAEYFFKTPVAGGDGGSVLTITLEHQASGVPQHTLGAFRMSVTAAPDPDAVESPPANILAILKTPAANRNDPQKNELAAYHRRVAASLKPVRARLAELRAATPEYPVVARRGQAGSLPVAINRTGAFASGDVQVTLEGFTLGRNADGPLPISRSLKFAPLVVPADNAVGALTFTVEGNAEQGTRLVVLRAEATVGDDTFVQYSPAFPLTIN